jgi:PhzF family phenazine biosynthesis protein
VTTKLPIWQVDAFTTRLYGGNPAAVVVLDALIGDETMQAIAAENNLAETAFIVARSDVSPLRWFTPTVEVDLCGHATLASAHVLFRYYFASLQKLVFSTRSGELSVTRDGELLALDFPARPAHAVVASEALLAALGIRAREVLRAPRDLLAIFDNEAQVRAFRPDFARIGALDATGLIISAPGEEVDFVSRFFAPKAGIPEDPATGSSHCTLAPYWAARLGKSRLTARQLSARVGEMRCELRGQRVLIAGGAVEYLRGEIEV